MEINKKDLDKYLTQGPPEGPDEEATLHCSECGEEYIQDGQEFCASCGGEMTTDFDEFYPEEEK